MIGVCLVARVLLLLWPPPLLLLLLTGHLW